MLNNRTMEFPKFPTQDDGDRSGTRPKPPNKLPPYINQKQHLLAKNNWDNLTSSPQTAYLETFDAYNDFEDFLNV